MKEKNNAGPPFMIHRFQLNHKEQKLSLLEGLVILLPYLYWHNDQLWFDFNFFNPEELFNLL